MSLFILALTVTWWCVRDIELEAVWSEVLVCGTGPGWCGDERVHTGCLYSRTDSWTGPGEGGPAQDVESTHTRRGSVMGRKEALVLFDQIFYISMGSFDFRL